MPTSATTVAPPRTGLRGAVEPTLIYLVALVVYALFGRRQDVPQFFPDEYFYAEVARSVSEGRGLTWNGMSQDLRAALYPLLIAPAWAFHSSATAYAVAKLAGAAMMSAVVVPTWILARRYLDARWAAAACVLAVAGTWMTATTGILTETLAYPLSALALAAMVLTILEPRSRWGLIALVAASLAAGARIQMLVLFPVFLAVLLADGFRSGAGLRGAVRLRPRLIGALTIVCVGGAAFVLAARTAAFGGYSGLDLTPPLGDASTSVARQTAAVLVMSGFIPFITLVAVSFRAASWKDTKLGPLLVVTWTSLVATVVQSGIAISGFRLGLDWSIERYVMYVLPLLFTVFVVAWRGELMSRVRLFSASVAVSVLLVILGAAVENVTEEPARYATALRVGAVFGSSQTARIAAISLLLGLVMVAIVSTRRLGAGRAMVSVLGLLFVVLVVQDQVAWKLKRDAAAAARAQLPPSLTWIEDAVDGPVARVVATTNSPFSIYTEFFNRNVRQVFVPESPVAGRLIRGRTCTWTKGPRGVTRFASGCGPLASHLLLDDDFAKFRFGGERVAASFARVGKVVEARSPSGAPLGTGPRLETLVTVPCGPPIPRVADVADPTTRVGSSCAPDLGGEFYLDRPALLRLGFIGGATGGNVVIAGRAYSIPAGGVKTISLPVPAQDATLAAQLDWIGPPPAHPGLVSATLQRGGARVDLLY